MEIYGDQVLNIPHAIQCSGGMFTWLRTIYFHGSKPNFGNMKAYLRAQVIQHQGDLSCVCGVMGTPSRTLGVGSHGCATVTPRFDLDSYRSLLTTSVVPKASSSQTAPKATAKSASSRSLLPDLAVAFIILGYQRFFFFFSKLIFQSWFFKLFGKQKCDPRHLTDFPQVQRHLCFSAASWGVLQRRKHLKKRRQEREKRMKPMSPERPRARQRKLK